MSTQQPEATSYKRGDVLDNQHGGKIVVINVNDGYLIHTTGGGFRPLSKVYMELVPRKVLFRIIRGTVLKETHSKEKKELVVLTTDEFSIVLAGGDEIIISEWTILDTHDFVRYADEEEVAEIESRL